MAGHAAGPTTNTYRGDHHEAVAPACRRIDRRADASPAWVRPRRRSRPSPSASSCRLPWRRHRSLARLLTTGYPASSACRWWWRTAPAPTAISAPRQWPGHARRLHPAAQYVGAGFHGRIRPESRHRLDQDLAPVSPADRPAAAGDGQQAAGGDERAAAQGLRRPAPRQAELWVFRHGQSHAPGHVRAAAGRRDRSHPHPVQRAAPAPSPISLRDGWTCSPIPSIRPIRTCATGGSWRWR